MPCSCPAAAGKAEQLAPYYAYWERAIFAGLNYLVLAGLKQLQQLVGGVKQGGEGGKLKQGSPLFKVGTARAAGSSQGLSSGAMDHAAGWAYNTAPIFIII